MKVKGEVITTRKMLQELRLEVSCLGGPAAASRKWGISAQAVSNATNCQKLPSPTILEEMGLEAVKEINYRYKRIK